MDITYLIGNGFDLNCGLNSKYTDVYNQYTKTESSSKLISTFKKEIDFHTNRWGDFEVAMSKYLCNFKNEDDFLTCLRDFRNYLMLYLKAEQDNYLTVAKLCRQDKLIQEEIRTSIHGFYSGITNNLDYQIKRMMANQQVFRNYISFNYTNVFDFYLSMVDSLNSVNHIHGTLERDIVLGMDNETQLSKMQYEMTNRTRRAFIKSFFNHVYDNNRLQNAIREIQGSDIICVFGMSLGESDAMWKNAIYSALQNNENCHVFIYRRRYTHMDVADVFERLDIEEEAKKEALSSIEILKDKYDSCFNRLHIPVGKRIFKLNYEDLYKRIDVINNEAERLKAQMPTNLNR